MLQERAIEFHSPGTASELALVLRTTLSGAILVGVMDGLGGLSMGLPGLALTGGLTLAYGLMVAFALRMAQQGQQRRAALLNAYSMLLLGITTVISTPLAQPACILVAMATPVFTVAHVPQKDMYAIGIGTVVSILVILVLARFIDLFPPIPEPTATLILVISTVVIAIILVLLFWQVQQRFTQNLFQLQQKSAALTTTQTQLEQQVQAQTASLTQALEELQTRADQQAALLAENTRQRQTIQQLGVPILPVDDHTLVIPLVGMLDQTRIELLLTMALRAIERSGARVVLLDVTGVEVLDPSVAAGLIQFAQAARLLGCKSWFIGIRPEMAESLVALHSDAAELATMRDLQSALATLRR